MKTRQFARAYRVLSRAFARDRAQHADRTEPIAAEIARARGNEDVLSSQCYIVI